MSGDRLSDALPKVAGVVRAASTLAANDVNFYKSIDQKISKSGEKSSNAILNAINELISTVESTDVSDVGGDTIKSSWSVVSNVLDTLLERSDIAYDNLRRKNKKVNDNHHKDEVTYLDDTTSINNNNHQIKRQDKPQLKFKTPIDNSESHPFRPLLRSKPHAIVPFEETFELTEAEEGNPSHYKQPYETEILNQEYNHFILEKSDPINFQDWESSEAVWVDDSKTLNEMLEALKSASEIAVDLEHHDYRSYYGIVCLMQISTRDQDWLIDTLALREELHVLNIIFTDPKITKVLHGAFMDIIWLQRDLGLYVVSLFDTYHASKQLGFPKHGLAYLLERFAHFKTSKKYQLADWRIRPLTKQMRAYARSDTHFLLYIYDLLKNMLLDSNKLDKVLYDSRNVAIRRFEYSRYRPTSTTNNNSSVVSPVDKPEPWKNLMYKYNVSPARSKIVQHLYEWRDQSAKDEDESPRFIMPDQLLVSLASLAPTDAAGVLASSNIISEYVRKNCKFIADLIVQSVKEIEQEDLRLLDDATDYQSQQTENDDGISWEKVYKNEEAFNAFQRKQIEVISPRFSPDFGKGSTLFSPDMLFEVLSDVCTASETPSLPKSFKDRQEMVYSKLSQFSLVELPQNDEIDINNDVLIDTKEEEEALESDKPAKKSNTMFENTEEIITLKKRNRQSQNENKKRIEPKGEAIDYGSAQTVMQKPSFKDKRNEKKRSSNQFDPYAQISDGPRPAKKQARMQQGKTASFINKKGKR